jgi:hypothetical protein
LAVRFKKVRRDASHSIEPLGRRQLLLQRGDLGCRGRDAVGRDSVR